MVVTPAIVAILVTSSQQKATDVLAKISTKSTIKKEITSLTVCSRDTLPSLLTQRTHHLGANASVGICQHVDLLRPWMDTVVQLANPNPEPGPNPKIDQPTRDGSLTGGGSIVDLEGLLHLPLIASKRAHQALLRAAVVADDIIGAVLQVMRVLPNSIACSVITTLPALATQ